MSTAPTTDLRYPIGKAHEQPAFSRAELIGHIAQLPSQLEAALAGKSYVDLQAHYRPGSWTVQQVVHHMADSHTVAYLRLKLAVAITTPRRPIVDSYPQEVFATLPDYQLPIEASLNILRGLHARMKSVFEGLTEAQWAMTSHHTENGLYTAEKILHLYAWHSRHHLAHVHNAFKAD